MRKILNVLLITFFTGAKTISQPSTVVFSDNFESYQNGSNGSPVWSISRGCWQVEKGTLVQKSKEYDCGAMLNLFLDSSFELAVDFKVLEGEPGAGFFFHSEDYKATEFSHMSRFESSQTILLGHFMPGGFECDHSARFETQNFSRWHRLILRIDQDRKQYRILLDGKSITEGEPLVFPAGYCGLQSSGGVIQFDNVRLSKLPMKTRPVTLSWLRQFLVSKNEIIVPHKSRGVIQRIDLKGELMATFGKPIHQKGQFEHPASIAPLSNGDYAIADQSLHRVHLFDRKGNWKNSVGYFGSGDDQLNIPVDIGVDGQDRILVVDEGNNRIQVWDRNLAHLTEFGKAELDHPVAVATNNDSVFVLNNGTNQVEIYSWEQGKINWKNHFSFGTGQGRDILVHLNNIYVSVSNEVRLYDRTGQWIKKFSGESIKGIYPYGLAIDKNEKIYIADFKAGHFIVVDKELSESQPSINFPRNTKVEITFDSKEKIKARLRAVTGDSIIFEGMDASGFQHKFLVNNLTPSTTYHFQFLPSLHLIPATDGFSKNYIFVTPPELGRKHYWRLPMVTIIFSNVLDTATLKPTWPELPLLSQLELDDIKSQIEDGIRFYWINSGMNLFIDNDYIIIDQKLFKHEIFGSQWWYPPIEAKVIQSIESAGKNVTDYVSVLYLACVRDYNEKKGKYELRGKGGGFTVGIGANSQHGLSYWEATPANHGSGNNWLMVHEFHHQLDELFLVSGYPEYWFNHFSPTINTAADFGEHFDGNAWILKNWPLTNWYDLKFGEIRFTNDEDRDGIPDDDPELPLDEKKIGSKPRSMDSDGDEVTDLNELQESNWILEGCGETYGGSTLFPNLIHPDTDGDGLKDNIDPYPLYPFKPIICYSPIQFDPDSTVIRNLKNPFARLLDRRIHATIYAQWDSLYLGFIFRMDRLAPIKLMIDADANGWFIGKDNYLIYLKLMGEVTLEREVQMINCADPQKWPFHDPELSKKIRLSSNIKKIDDEYIVTVLIPEDNYTGFILESGEKIGVNIGFSVLMDQDGHQRYVTIFEPNRLFDVELVK